MKTGIFFCKDGRPGFCVYWDKLSYLSSLFTAADQTKAMQEQMSGAGVMTPPDPMKAFKGEWEALEVCNHQWCLQGVEEDLIDGPVQPETIYIKNKYA